MSEKSEVTQYIESLVAPEYVISINDIAASFEVDIENDKLQYKELMNRTKEELQDYILLSLSWMERVSRVKTATGALKDSKDLERHNKKYKLIYAEMERNNFARGAKSDAEIKVEADDEQLALKKKIAHYSQYISYLSDLLKQLEMLHYTCKDLLRESSKAQNLY